MMSWRKAILSHGSTEEGRRCGDAARAVRIARAFVLDAYSRRIVGWQLAGHMRTRSQLELAVVEYLGWFKERPPTQRARRPIAGRVRTGGALIENGAQKRIRSIKIGTI
jgi:hypothetical protein